MKSTFLTLCCIAVSACLFSCKKNADTVATKQVVIDTTIASGSLFTFNLGSYGSRASITKQANEFTTSNLVQGSHSSGTVYQFSYAAKTAVTEQVVLAVTNNEHGNCGNHSTDSTVVTLNMSIQ